MRLECIARLRPRVRALSCATGSTVLKSRHTLKFVFLNLFLRQTKVVV